jgi:hypothetical protein
MIPAPDPPWSNRLPCRSPSERRRHVVGRDFLAWSRSVDIIHGESPIGSVPGVDDAQVFLQDELHVPVIPLVKFCPMHSSATIEQFMNEAPPS